MSDITLEKLAHTLDSHEKVCEERQKNIDKRFTDLKWFLGFMHSLTLLVMLAGFGLLVALMPSTAKGAETTIGELDSRLGGLELRMGRVVEEARV